MYSTAIMVADEFPGGLACMDCYVVIEPGELYADNLVGMEGAIPLADVTCINCAVKRLEAP